MLSAFGANYASSGAYRDRLRVEGYGVDYQFKDADGVVRGHADVHEAFEGAYARHRGENVQRCGASDRENRKIRRRFSKAVQDDVKDSFHLSWGTIAFGVLLTIVGGPVGFIVAVVAVLFEYYLTKDLDGDKSLRAAFP